MCFTVCLPRATTQIPYMCVWQKKGFVNIAPCPHEPLATQGMAWGTSCLIFDEADIPVVFSRSSLPRHKLAERSNHGPMRLHPPYLSHAVVDVDLKGKK